MNAQTTITLDQYYTAVVADIKAAFPLFVTVEFDREDRSKLPLPACLLEIPAFDDAEDEDPGTEQWACDARVELRVLLPFNDDAVKLECRKLATAIAVWLRKRRFNHPTEAGKALPTGAAKVVAAEKDDFDPTLDKFDVWRVDFVQRMHFGASVFDGETGTSPANPVYSYAPEIGTGNEDEYTPVVQP